MKKILILGIVAVMLLALIGGTVMAKGGNNKAAGGDQQGDLQEDAFVFAWQSHSVDVAGAIIKSIDSQIGPKKQDWSLGLVDTELSMAYNWDFFPHNKNALLYAVTKSLIDTKDYTLYD